MCSFVGKKQVDQISQSSLDAPLVALVVNEWKLIRLVTGKGGLAMTEFVHQTEIHVMHLAKYP